MEKDIKKLFENFKMLNPDFKLNEDDTFIPTFDTQTNTPPENSETVSDDVRQLETVYSTVSALSTASKKINKIVEFSELFKFWFQTLGYEPGSGVIKINSVIEIIKQDLSDLGYN